MALNVAVISGRDRQPLNAAADLKEPTVVPAQYLTIEVEGDDLPEMVYLDNKQLRLLHNDAHSRGFLMVDTAGSVGFHRLHIADTVWYFATQDGKLKLNGIIRILDFLATEGLAWSGQLFFADGSAIRNPRIDYAWLEKTAPEILALAEAIAARPLRRAQRVRTQKAPGAGKLFLKSTFDLIRTNARSFLEQDEDGRIAVGGSRYSPRVVVAGRLERSYEVVGNSRMTHLLQLVLALTQSLQSEARVPSKVKTSLRELSDNLRTRLELFPFAQLRAKPLKLPSRPASEEVADERYRHAFDIYEELSKELGWEPGLQIADRAAYVGYADQIYQAFVALVLARAFETKQVCSSLWSQLSIPLFRSNTHDIYYDTVPPTPEFSNWRAASNRPGEQRPDLTIVDRQAARGILADAKYRVEVNGKLPVSGIHDAQVYLQSFERKSIVICYPGAAPSINRVTGKGYTILEVAIGPFVGLEPYVRDHVRPAIEAAMEQLGA